MGKKSWEKIVIAIGLGILGYLLWWKARLGLARFFDVDEFAYLHWAHNVFTGKTPILDFFMYAPPLYLWFLAPLYYLGSGITPVIAARILEFLIFSGLCLATGYLFWQVRKSLLGAILAMVILAFLPLPADKFLEIRPDNLATLLVLLGMIWQIRWLEQKDQKAGFWSGVFYGLSLLVLPKTLPNVAVGVGIAFLSSSKRFLYLGLVLPFIFFGIWALLHNLNLTLYSLIQLPFEVNKVGKMFIMRPDLFFYPNNSFYGLDGVNAVLLSNHALWILGLGMGLYRLLTKRNLSEILIAGNLFIQVFFYVYLFPMRHAQYLIPVAVFIAFYGADFFKTKLNLVWLGVFFIILSEMMNPVKINRTNQLQLAQMQAVWQKIPKREYVLDLTGQTIYYPDPYYISAVPFGQFTYLMSRQPPDLITSLIKTKTKYIWADERLETLQKSDLDYMLANFQEDPVTNLWVRKN